MSSQKREIVYQVLQFLDEEDFKGAMHKWVLHYFILINTLNLAGNSKAEFSYAQMLEFPIFLLDSSTSDV